MKPLLARLLLVLLLCSAAGASLARTEGSDDCPGPGCPDKKAPETGSDKA